MEDTDTVVLGEGAGVLLPSPLLGVREGVREESREAVEAVEKVSVAVADMLLLGELEGDTEAQVLMVLVREAL